MCVCVGHCEEKVPYSLQPNCVRKPYLGQSCVNCFILLYREKNLFIPFVASSNHAVQAAWIVIIISLNRGPVWFKVYAVLLLRNTLPRSVLRYVIDSLYRSLCFFSG